MSFFDNLFGTIGQTGALDRVRGGIDFIPNGSGGEIIKLTDKSSPVWLGMRSPWMQLYAYEFCYPIASVVDSLADYDLTSTIEILRLGGKGKDDFATNSWAQAMNKLLEQPNPLQSWGQFRGQQIIYKKVFGFCPVVPLIPVGFAEAVSLINLPPWLFDVEGSGTFMYQSRIQDFVKSYRVSLDGKIFDIAPDKLFILTDSFLQNQNKNFLLPLSKLVGLDMAISNICAAMEADNVLLRKKGPLGFISHDAAAVKDSVAGYLPMTDEDKDELQSDLQKYGLSFSQFQYVVSKIAAKWNPMSYNVKELGTKETLVAGEQAICHRFRFPYVLYEQSGTTYANGENAEQALYTSNIIPNADKDLQHYNKFFKARENNCVIVANFDNTPCLQEDKKEAADAEKTLSEALEKEYLNNVITLNQWRVKHGYDTVDGDDTYYRDIKQPEVQPVI